MEWVPISEGSKPRVSFPIALTADRRALRMAVDERVAVDPEEAYCRYVLTGESVVVLG